MPKTALHTASQRDLAYRNLRRLLVLQQLQPGERLREPEWAQRLSVHRTALREAFARLEAEGLIERGPQTGYFIPELMPRDVLEITRLRLAFECLAIDETCANPKRQLKPLQDAIAHLARFLDGEDSLGVLEADRRFHEALIDAANMRRLAALYHRAPLPMIHRRTDDPRAWTASCRRTLAEHRKILVALEKGDAPRARQLLRNHLIPGSIRTNRH